MSKDVSERGDTFPDVRIDAKRALIAILILAALYGGLFVAFAGPDHAEGWGAAASFVLGGALLLLSYIDMRTGLLLDLITLPLIALGVAYSGLVDGLWLGSLLGAGIGYGLVAGLAYIWRKYRAYEGVGLGDAKLLAAGGAWIGISLLPITLLVASGLGIISALTVSQKTRNERDRIALPFGPFIGIGIWLCWCAGEMILKN